jgi:PAS domain S-box-containing protein
MSATTPTDEALRADNAELRARLEEAEEMLRAIRSGEVDALVIEGDAGPQLFALQGLDAEQNRLRGEMLAQVSDAVIATDLDRHVTFINAAAERHFGLRASDVLGCKFVDLYTRKWPNTASEAGMWAALQECDGWRGELTHHTPDGRQLHAEMVVSAMHASDGTANGYVAAIHDITQSKRAQEELRDADRRKDEFLATLAHELRNPLAPVRNALQVLHMTGPAIPELQWARDVIDRQVQAMTRLIDDLMDVSRINRGKIELKREHVDLAKVVRGAIEPSRPLIEEMGHELSVTLPTGAVVVDADLTRLAQVFQNLLNNAAKYTERGGRIDLRAEVHGGDVVVSVTDTGIGIQADKLPTLFEMFSQVDGTLSRSQGGLGIGLCLVKQLVDLHGGSVEATSGGPGQGSAFEVRLPVVVERTYRRQVSNDGDKARSTSNLRILVVDDNRDAAESLAMLLKIMGNDVHLAHDGEEAVTAAAKVRPDVVLCDLGLPKLNGYEACRRMKAQAWTETMTLIAVTGWGQDDDRRKSQEAGFDHHLVKPVDPQSLMKLLAGLETVKV